MPEIDELQGQQSLNILDNVITQDNSNNIITQEDGGQITLPGFNTNNIDPVSGNNELAREDNIIDESEQNAFGFVNTSEFQ